MSRRSDPVLHRDDPSKEPLVGHVKVTREDWLNVARAILVGDGVAEVKILPISERLGVSRSSFYWYFKNREDLLGALLEDWARRNTSTLVAHCGMPAATITGAVCNFFRCFLAPDLFDPGLDFAVREWARRDAAVREIIDRADKDRLAAVREMFARHGYDPFDADVRARILYFMQLGYHALEQAEPMAERLGRLEGYLEGFTGHAPAPGECDALRVFAKEEAGS
ncbi:TetR/AcrR family transcriptional regulator [Limibaculum sp. M0105]|uniref:TetR/AcrR family transcriptional regulator n=1 Tax=Thermohalobaculum xanthum TaxID=2753746 RepID=A0A8J7SFI1_9RHOB|nr:TetR/AcrR family transcriptional regulator [Thermohalobaculum xanthum]MBK0399552.1 TetR/AcrR family transcriptional regulator [Thermohalobaculum xanthum]